MFYAKYQHSVVKYENACTILQTRLKSHTISNKVETAWLFEKHGGECGIRTHVPLRTISSAARYDHFDNSPNQCIRIVKSNDDTTLCIISYFTKKSKLFFKIVLVHKFHLNVLVKIISFVVFSLVLQKGLTFPEKSIIIK
mgnify:CR=1 FL=1